MLIMILCFGLILIEGNGIEEKRADERLTTNKDLIGDELIPIAALFVGNFLCLDFRVNRMNPSVCVWSHEESDIFEPVTYDIAESFDAFIRLLER